jgi:hypothetical protein
MSRIVHAAFSPYVISAIVMILLSSLSLPLGEQKSASGQVCRTMNETTECIGHNPSGPDTISITTASMSQQQRDRSHTQSTPPFISGDENNPNSQSGRSHGSKDIQNNIPSVLSPNIPFP